MNQSTDPNREPTRITGDALDRAINGVDGGRNLEDMLDGMVESAIEICETYGPDADTIQFARERFSEALDEAMEDGELGGGPAA